MISVSDAACAAIRRVLAGNANGATGMRIMVEMGGCAGMKYMVGLERTAQPEDQVFAFDGLSIFIDPMTMPVVDGMNIDYVEHLDGAGFVFDNPNAANRCSCGKSFSQ